MWFRQDKIREIQEENRRFREEFIQELTPEERVKGLSAEELLKGLSAEELLRAFTPEQRKVLERAFRAAS
ncbi:MAG: hypothetical protein ACKO6N_14795 [Myxococcota bacterium]